MLSSMNIKTRLIVAFILLALITAFGGITSKVLSDRIVDKGVHVGEILAPLADAAMEIKLTATTAHLLFEEIVAGDESEDIQEVWKLLDETLWYSNAILNGGSNEEGTFTATDSPEVREKIEKVSQLVTKFIESAKQRYAQRVGSSGTGSEVDQAFDQKYDTLQNGLKNLAEESKAKGATEALAATGDARFSLANGHLFLEELLAGDEEVKAENVLKDMEDAKTAIEAISPALAASADELISLTKSRISATAKHGSAGSKADEDFDQAYEEFVAIADEAESLIHAQMEAGIEAIEKSRSTNGFIQIAVTLLSVALALALGFLVGRPIGDKIHALSQIMDAIANGKTETEIAFRNQKDEIGEMANAVQVFRDNLVTSEKAKIEKEAAEAEERKKRAATQSAIEAFNSEIGNIVAKVTKSSGDMRGALKAMTGKANDNVDIAKGVASSAVQANENVQTVASAAEELSASSSEIGQQVSHASEIANKAAQQASHTNELVEGLDTSAQRIGEVVQLITDIATQTNLLALNATIEAARAGEAGKGFAVVASEVKNLANQTGNATEEISAQISAIQQATSEAVDAIREITKVIDDVNGISSSIATAVEEQSAATQEIARNVELASSGTSQVSNDIESIRMAAEENGATAGTLAVAAGDLTEEAEILDQSVKEFLKKVG